MNLFSTFLRLSLLAFCAFAVTAFANSKVSISINGQVNEYPYAPRLTDVLAPIALTQDWYWPASRLYRTNSPEPEQLRKQVLDKLAKLALTAEEPLKQSYQFLMSDITNWQLAKRVPIPIDFDLARINPAANPRFEAGQYLLLLSTRPTQVYIFGAVNRSIELPHLAVAPVQQYLSRLSSSAFADKQRVWIMQPDATFNETLVQAWANQPAQVMPGAVIFIPFAANIFNKDIDRLNTLLLALAVNRVL